MHYLGFPEHKHNELFEPISISAAFGFMTSSSFVRETSFFLLMITTPFIIIEIKAVLELLEVEVVKG